MTKTKYLLYSLKLNTNGKYTYWNETDNKYFKEKKPPKHILDNINLEVDILEENKIIKKSWLEYTNYIIDNDLDKVNDQIIRNEGLLKSLKNDN